MARLLSTALVLAVLAATAAAFAVTEHAKLARSPIYGTRVAPKTFSPDCARPCTLGSETVTIAFRLRVSEKIDVWIQHGDDRVRTLVSGRSYPRRRLLSFVWDGQDESGAVVPDGTYKPYVKLERSHRTIGLPNGLVLDTKPPVITVPHPLYPIISPDGDGHKDAVRVAYRLDEPAHAVLLVGSHQVLLTYRQPLHGTLVWNGKLGRPPKPVRPGRYVLYVSARDLAGNVAKPYPFAIVQVRYVALARKQIAVRPGARFAVRVSTDAPHLTWRLGGRSGVLPRGTLHLRAPRAAGVYRLYVFAARHAARAVVTVG